LIYKRDVARACVSLAYKKQVGTEVFNLSAPPIEMREFVGVICQCLGRKPLPLSIPAWILKPAFWLNARTLSIRKVNELEQTVEKWLSNDLYSARKIKEAYGFEPVTTIIDAAKLQTETFKKSKEN
jgi:nucleoside-diphosphate-sugar epimerase